MESMSEEVGGDTEGPEVLIKQSTRYRMNKDPNGSKKAQYHVFHDWHRWIFDFYPPKQGGMDAIMKLRLPHNVDVRILEPGQTHYQVWKEDDRYYRSIKR